MSELNACAGTAVFVLSLLSVPLSYSFNHLITTQSTETVLIAAVSVVVVLSHLAGVLLKQRAPTDPLFYVFALYALLSVVNLIIGLEQDGIIDSFVTFYLKQANPHINTAHGHMISYWDGCAHYLMYLLMVAAITWGESYRLIGLYWLGSFLMQVIVYIPGSVVGKYGAQLNALFLLHLLYVSVSVWACFRVFIQPATRDIPPTNVQCEQMKSLLHRPVDLFFILGLIITSIFSVLRGLVVLDCPADWCRDYVLNYEPYLKDTSAYPTVQMLVNMLYSTPCVIMMMYGLCVPGCDWLPDLSLVHAGAIAQAQFCHIGASLHTRTPVMYRIPSERLLFFCTFNLFYALIPQALSYRCISRPAFFISTTQHSRTN
ncbi:transmembrane 6 superfamily member 1-like isoform X1 [Silurus meridionalis]|uniref:transmembrane 6 superfamily member 1-like isoform X1 n=1 Tax=Silurus meridionalis TaxID=175797 RepID=UPI001EEA5C00|nr:transmembrane 6 superfamily member 1-like isoform X1 [Silurus meridionalis]KAI5097858.1 transmembrane 6 superfamily member 1 isoform X1 [Silurus meridionalis]